MKKFTILSCLFLLPAVAVAVENGRVMYVGGTAVSIKDGALGRLDTTSETVLGFSSGTERLAIPFTKIESYEYSQDGPPPWSSACYRGRFAPQASAQTFLPHHLSRHL